MLYRESWESMPEAKLQLVWPRPLVCTKAPNYSEDDAQRFLSHFNNTDRLVTYSSAVLSHAHDFTIALRFRNHGDVWHSCCHLEDGLPSPK